MFIVKLINQITSIISSEKNYYTYAIVRTDLEPIHQLIQISHATQEAGKKFGYSETQNNLICLGVNNKIQLFNAMKMLKVNGIKTVAFYEPDYSHGLTAIATDYVTEDNDKKLFKQFKLLSFDK